DFCTERVRGGGDQLDRNRDGARVSSGGAGEPADRGRRTRPALPGELGGGARELFGRIDPVDGERGGFGHLRLYGKRRAHAAAGDASNGHGRDGGGAG